jgi:type IX secretion system PorP/SprF family membrane protein
MNTLSMKKIFTLALAVFSGLFSFSQQDPQFSQNRFINTSFNPGASGIKEMNCFGLIARQQWIGFEGAPTTAMLTYDGYLSSINSGIGGVFVFDKIGLESNLFVKLNFSKHLTLGKGKLGIGVDVGLINKQINGLFLATNPSDPSLVSLSGQSAMNFDLGAGLFYYSPKLYFGVSGQKLIPQKVNWGTAQPQIRPHTYFTGGYNYAVGDSGELVLKPSFLVKTDFTATQVDVNLIAEYRELFWLGASYRIEDAIVAMVGYNADLGRVIPRANKLKIGLAYDFTTSNLRNAGDFDPVEAGEPIKSNNRSVGSVEIYLGYCFVSPPKPNFDQYVDPLFLNN